MTVIDVSGHPTGGSARWRREAERWVAAHPESGVLLIGKEQRVTGGWLARRERIARSERRIAANNVSFIGGSGQRVVLLRNPLHFLRPGEAERLPAIPRGIRAQIPIVRAAARRAKVIVVPSTHMAERVEATLPRLRRRIVVRHHPLTVSIERRAPSGQPFVLFPSLPSPQKDLIGSLQQLTEAVARFDLPLVAKVTAMAAELGEMAACPHVDPIGAQSMEAMDNLREEAAAVYLPSQMESFGYPLAEARAGGIPALAPETAQCREIAGPALFGYAHDDPESIGAALKEALVSSVRPDPSPFDRDAYFLWLTQLS